MWRDAGVQAVKQRIRKWLGIADDSAKIQALEDRIRLLELPAAKVERTAADMMKPVIRPFAVNRVPGRKLRAELEWKNSPEFRKLQENLRETKAKQPNGH